MTSQPLRPAVTVEIADAAAAEAALADLGAILHACVHDGASVSFVLPFKLENAVAFFRDEVLPAVRGGRRALFLARAGGRLVGTVQLDEASQPNQPHRAEVRKLLVPPAERRRGVARALMAALEAEAARRGRMLLTLDTRTGDAAEPLYAGLGYSRVGAIPGYSVDPRDTGRLDSTTIYYKAL